MTGDLYNIIYEDGPMRFQAPAMRDSMGRYYNLASGRVVVPLSVDVMALDRAMFHEEQALALRRKLET